MSEIACRRRAVTSSTSARPDSVALINTSRRLSGLGPRSTHPPVTIRSIDRLNVDEFAPIRSARLPIRSGPELVKTTSTRNCGSVTNSRAGETDRATTPSSARDAVRIASVVWARRRGAWLTAILSCTALHFVECTSTTVASLHRKGVSRAESGRSAKRRHCRSSTGSGPRSGRRPRAIRVSSSGVISSNS
jgi:hypothetical protein